MKGPKMYNHKPSKLQWLKDHSFEIGFATVVTAMMAAVVVISVNEQEALQQKQEKQDNWYKEQLQNGYTIIEQDDHLVAVQVKSIY